MTISRRDFVRSAALGTLGLLAGCASDKPNTPVAPAPSSAPPPSLPASPRTGPAWRTISAKGPSARRDYSFAGDPSTGRAYLFGGRASGEPLGDLWVFDGTTWAKGSSKGPLPRFGHNAVVRDGVMLLFGGQAGSTFFNDVWELDLASLAWKKIPSGSAPAPRYGAGGTLAGDQFIVSHGFTNDGRFDDTWSWGESSWQNISPSSGARPVKRCLHRTLWLPAANAILLFGGQTNGNPFLGDSWLYSPAAKTWQQVKPSGAPSPRTLYATFTLGDTHWVFGGTTADGPSNTLHASTDPVASWRTVNVGGGPSPRSGIEAAVVSETVALIFGGRSEADQDDLWLFTA